MLDRRQRATLLGVLVFGGALVLLLARPGTPRAAAPVLRGQAQLPVTSVASPTLDEADWPFETRAVAVAIRNQVDPALVLAIIQVESGHDPEAVSYKGAQGLMQVMPETGALVGYETVADPLANLEAGTRYLATLLDMFGGDVELALAAYNAGPGAVRRWGTIPPYRETRDFVQRVSEAYHRLTGLDVRAAGRLAPVREDLPLF